MKKIIYTRPEGGLSVVHPVRNTHPTPEEIDDAAIEQRAWDKLPADAINPRWVDAFDIPTDRTFRNAWEDNGGVQVNMPKAREIYRGKLREFRKPMLAALDTAYLRADEIGDTAEKARIAAKKQALRDVTDDPAIGAAETPEELKAVLPEALK